MGEKELNDNEFYLTLNINNSKTKKPYGISGELVKSILIRGNCHIVENKRGERFAVNETYLSKNK